MTPLFIDSDALYALNNSNDPSHAKAHELVSKIIGIGKYKLFLGTNILIETITLVSQRIGKQNAINLLDAVRTNQYTVINPDDTLINSAENIFRNTLSKNVSYSDCISFSIMKSYNISWVLSFDEHFKQQGFKRIGIDGIPK
jgi:uncharacterized protein